MMFIDDFKNTIAKNRSIIFLLSLFLMLGYGYFITHWAISVDSEYGAFNTSPYLGWISQGRFIICLLNLLTNSQVMPFWNDTISVLLIMLSSMVWIVNFSKVGQKNDMGVMLFVLLYCLSPVYCFYLRFTMYNYQVTLGMLFSSIAIYYFILGIQKNQLLLKCACLSMLYLFLAIGIYQLYVTYFITAVMVILLAEMSLNKNSNESKIIFRKLIVAVLILLSALILYKLTLKVLYHFVKPSDYINGFWQWGTISVSDMINRLTDYFYDILFVLKFNFLLPFTIVCFGIFLVLSLIFRKVSIYFLILSLLLIVSVFMLVFLFGVGMPFRTYQAEPLMIGGIWLVMYNISKNIDLLRKLIFLIILGSSFANAQYINRIFYGDNLRLMYDIDFANRIYASVINVAGGEIRTKSLAIVGEHKNNNELIIRTNYDTLGYSFFEWDNGNHYRMYTFMRWLGDDYMIPSSQQFDAAQKIAKDMPSYPAKGSILVTKDMIILKL